ncbi:MAG: hypothetical protein OQJ93_11125 [Ignavibacteriaceae bacterium]|jgi:hypothetical protein|nr:hypothetical protein [Ignavibacteriaceae bacterium]MCW8812184.1 hypothetical protein [Chlorobium sp.]MCW8996592.1 hypothetical protein [Psychromonas sp.]MCW8817930.1 hypothetical protein [Ignavibacteriaceae bacterium]MCW8822445.1 hypothetical protein [Ignavibacteriaceae bacterium]
MGQQQLLLIVLGVIIVGIAVVVGINLFNANAEESAKDGIVSDCTNLGAMAQQYYKKPTSMGGGGNTFDGTGGTPASPPWDVPINLATTANGTYTAGVTAQQVVITGVPIASNGYLWTVITTVTPTSIGTIVNTP